MEAAGQTPDARALAANFNWPAVLEGFRIAGGMDYASAHAELLKTPDGTPGEYLPLFPGGAANKMPGPANQPDLPPAPDDDEMGAHVSGEDLPGNAIFVFEPAAMLCPFIAALG